MPEYKQTEIRDRLANERTLLAWVRTSLAYIALGLALAKLALFLEAVTPAGASARVQSHMPARGVSFAVGVALVGFGGVVSLVGAWRSHVWSRAIDPDAKAPENLSLGLVAALTALMSVGLLVYLLVR